MHLTSLYPTALTSTNDHLTVLKVHWQQHCGPPEAYAMCCKRITCNANIYPS